MKSSLKLYLHFLSITVLLLTTNIVLAAIELAVEANPDPAQPSEAVSVAITVTNSGNSQTGSVTLQMQWIGDFLNNMSDDLISDGGTCAGTCSGNEFVSWALGTMNAGETRTITLPPMIWGSTPFGTSIPFTAEVFEGGIKQAESTATVVVEDDPPFDIAVDEDANPVGPGEDLVYTITYSNRGTTSATQTSLSFPLPAGTSFVSATDGVTPSAGVVTWDLGTVPGLSGSEKKVRVTVNNGLPQGSLLEVDAAEITGLVNSLSNISSAMAVTRVESDAPLLLGLEQNPDPAQPNETLNTELTVTNVSGGQLNGLTLRMRWIGAYLNNLSDTVISDGGTCAGTCSGNEFVVWTLGTMNAGETRTVTLPPEVWGFTPLGELLTFNTTVTEDGRKLVEQSHTVRVQNDPPFDISVDEDVNPVGPGEDLVYTITYSNRGTTSATQTSLSFPLPVGTSFVSATDGVTPLAGVVTWDLGTVPGLSGNEKKVRVTVNNGVAEGSLLEVDAAEITGLVNSLPNTSSAMAVTRVESNAPLLLGLEQNPDPAQPNETLNTALTVTNVSGGQLFGVTLRMRWIGTYLNNLNDALISDGGTCAGTCSGNEFVVWTLGTMNAGETRTVTLPPEVWGFTPLGELLTFNTTVTEDGRKLVEQSHTVRIQDNPPFDIAVDEDMSPVAPGEDLVYTITYSNRGTTSATQTNLSFPLPAGTSFVSATDGATPSGGVVIWNPGTVPGQSGSELKVRVAVNNDLAEGSLLEVDAAEITGLVNSLPNTSSAMAVTRVESNAPLLLGLEQNPDPVLPSETLDTALTVANVSGGQLNGVTLRMRWIDDYLNNLNDALISDGGTCVGTCSVNEFVVWTLGTMNAGETRTVTLPPVIWGFTPLGELLTFNASVTEDGLAQSISSNTVFIGSDFDPVPDPPPNGEPDTDLDGIPDDSDNCINEQNGPDLGPNDQLDTDNDGFGNICDGDLDNSGFVNSVDFSIFKQRLLTNDPDADLDGDGFVNSVDFSIFKTLLLSPPGPSGQVF